MAPGLLEFREDRHQSLPWMLACPFLDVDRHAANIKPDNPVHGAQE